jgi:cellulose biosynthesis protein BcsQ
MAGINQTSMRVTPIIAFSGIQSGAGKTRAALHTAAGLAAAGKRVLLIDTDFQNSIALALGVSVTELPALDQQSRTLSRAFLEGPPLAECAGRDNPAVIYAGSEVPQVDFETFARDPDPELALHRIAARSARYAPPMTIL